MKKLLMISTLILLSTPVLAAETLKISVNGLVCDFCAQAIEKVFHKQGAINTIHVDLTNKLITTTLKPEKTMTNEEITKLITDAGYNVTKIERENTDE